MSRRTNVFLIINLGCEMMYVIDQRLKAQCISVEKSAQGKYLVSGLFLDWKTALDTTILSFSHSVLFIWRFWKNATRSFVCRFVKETEILISNQCCYSNIRNARIKKCLKRISNPYTSIKSYNFVFKDYKYLHLNFKRNFQNFLIEWLNVIKKVICRCNLTHSYL